MNEWEVPLGWRHLHSASSQTSQKMCMFFSLSLESSKILTWRGMVSPPSSPLPWLPSSMPSSARSSPLRPVWLLARTAQNARKDSLLDTLCIDFCVEPQVKSQCTKPGLVHWKPMVLRVGHWFHNEGISYEINVYAPKHRVFNAPNPVWCIDFVVGPVR